MFTHDSNVLHKSSEAIQWQGIYHNNVHIYTAQLFSSIMIIETEELRINTPQIKISSVRKQIYTIQSDLV